MSDLQCPARVVLVVRDLLPSLAAERVSGVFVAPAIASDATSLAAVSGFALQVNCRLDSLNGAIDGASLVRALQELSDVYRGETIVVVAPLDMLRDAIGHSGDAAHPIVVSIDSSGWTVLGPSVRGV